MSAEGLAIAVFTLAALPALLCLWNLMLFRQPPAEREPARPKAAAAEAGKVEAKEDASGLVSILIPARNEEAGIAQAVLAVLGSRGVDVEVVVMDDQSEDETAARVAELALQDGRVRLLHTSGLPAGWCGKQHACHLLAEAARGDRLLFLDADVRLTPDATARLVAFLEHSGAGLVSGIPRQITGTAMEKLLIPLIHFLLLGYLPFAGMRCSRMTGFGAGCGQLFIARRDAYVRAGGHAAICASLHDGVTLPRAFRRAGIKTDLCDATEIASCRMYRSSREVWNGLRKNAGEGIGSPALIGPFTLLLVGGHIVPFLWAALGAFGAAPFSGTVGRWLTAAVIAAWLPRWIAAWRFRQSWLGAFLHPLGIGTFLALQWTSFLGELRGKRVSWRDRVYN